MGNIENLVDTNLTCSAAQKVAPSCIGLLKCLDTLCHDSVCWKHPQRNTRTSIERSTVVSIVGYPPIAESNQFTSSVMSVTFPHLSLHVGHLPFHIKTQYAWSDGFDFRGYSFRSLQGLDSFMKSSCWGKSK